MATFRVSTNRLHPERRHLDAESDTSALRVAHESSWKLEGESREASQPQIKLRNDDEETGEFEIELVNSIARLLAEWNRIMELDESFCGRGGG